MHWETVDAENNVLCLWESIAIKVVSESPKMPKVLPESPKMSKELSNSPKMSRFSLIAQTVKGSLRWSKNVKVLSEKPESRAVTVLYESPKMTTVSSESPKTSKFSLRVQRYQRFYLRVQSCQRSLWESIDVKGSPWESKLPSLLCYWEEQC